MYFGVGGFDELVGSVSNSNSADTNNQKWYGSEYLKQERSVTATVEDDYRSSKLSKTNISLRSNVNNASVFSNALHHHQMLSFSSSPPPHSEPNFVQAALAFSRNSGYNYGDLNAASMQEILTMGRWPFTPPQLVELENQTLIYKYITSNVPIPSNLLIPIKKSFDSTEFCGFTGGFFRPNSLGWGSIHMGFSHSTDPEIGRCRRTDGKKWRCSRDAVADQKYCERHMNRGRHRSRKPVEGQTGHSFSGTNTATVAKIVPVAFSAASVESGGGGSNNMAFAQELHLQSHPSSLSAATPTNGMFLNKEYMGDRMQDPTIDFKSKENTFMNLKQQISYGESSVGEFRLVSSYSVNPAYESFVSSQDIDEQKTESESNPPAIPWTDLHMQSDRTQLSISLPMASNNNGSLEPSPLRLASQFDHVQMGLGVGSVKDEPIIKGTNWIPISWDSSMGGPLGEVLHNTNNSVVESHTSTLNLMNDGWDSTPNLGSSPTGVLQKTAFRSLSSSAGSSPHAENRSCEAASMCNDLLSSSLAST